MKKILFITAFLPHPGAAAEKNTMYMLDRLSKTCRVDLIYFKYNNQPEYKSKTEKIQVLNHYEISLYSKIINLLQFQLIKILAIHTLHLSHRNKCLGVGCLYYFHYQRFVHLASYNQKHLLVAFAKPAPTIQ